MIIKQYFTAESGYVLKSTPNIATIYASSIEGSCEGLHALQQFNNTKYCSQ